MTTINAHMYATKEAAQDAVALLNSKAYSPRPGNVTSAYCRYFICQGGYYIIPDDITIQFLDEPQEVTLPENDE